MENYIIKANQHKNPEYWEQVKELLENFPLTFKGEVLGKIVVTSSKVPSKGLKPTIGVTNSITLVPEGYGKIDEIYPWDRKKVQFARLSDNQLIVDYDGWTIFVHPESEQYRLKNENELLRQANEDLRKTKR